MAVHNEERKFRLLAFFTYIEDKHAASIQRAYRARVWPPARESSRFVAGDELGEVPTEPDLYGGFLPSRFVRIVVGSDEVRDSCARGIPPTMDEFKEARLVEDVPNGSETSLPRFGKPTGQLTAQLQMVAEEIALRRGATLLRRFSRQAIKHDLHNNLKGVLWKRNYRIPRFQRRAVYVTPMYADCPPALCYVGPPPNNFEKQIPLASISSVMFESERRFEFSIDATSCKHKLVFRAYCICQTCAPRVPHACRDPIQGHTAAVRVAMGCSCGEGVLVIGRDDEKECYMWIDGISLLLSLSDYADYVPL